VVGCGAWEKPWFSMIFQYLVRLFFLEIGVGEV